ncbi:MAG: DUF805 domain-containing protein [Candidatus Staskawiczbacteria bacterium]|nr:DUF805 domain-containing protein [Candidatus Staskawiczbacteria bacterium]
MKFYISRLGQSGFTISLLISFAIIFLLFILNAPMWFTLTFVYINFAWMILLYIGRLHDVGYSGWWTIFAMFTSLLGMIILASYSGNKEANKYGEVPPRSISHLLHFWRTKKVV